MFNEKSKLSNGVEIPMLGLGTWLLDDEQTSKAVQEAMMKSMKEGSPSATRS